MTPYACPPICQAAIEHYIGGMTLQQVADALDVPLGRIRTTLIHHQIARRSLGRTLHTCSKRCDAITTAYRDEGASLEAIGITQGLSRERVRQILRAHHVPTRSPSPGHKHVCDDLCAAILADPHPSATRIGDRVNVTPGQITHRMQVHGIANVRPAASPHQCGERCRALIAEIQTHPDDTAYTVASRLRIPASWMNIVFRHRHPDLWRVRSYTVRAGRRVATAR